MSEKIESYWLNDIKVEVREDEDPDKLIITCSDEEDSIQFRVGRDEFRNYRRLSNIRLQEAFEQYKEERKSEGEK